MTPDPCPDPTTLEAFLLGKLPERDFECIAEHIHHCAFCGDTLCSLDDRGDALLEQLRSLRHGGASIDAEVPRKLINAARSAANDLSTAGRDLVIDPGRRIAETLACGSFSLGKFELLEELGFGSFGHVFRARDTELDRIVAVKIHRHSALSSSEEQERFLREARSAAQLKHPNIVALYETGHTEDGACYLVSEFVEGETLESGLRHAQFKPAEAARLVGAVAEALHYAHSKGVIHRDIKPANLLVDSAGQPYIMDFGLAKRDAGEVTVTLEGDLMGTPAYMSPEQARGEGHHVDARSDIFSLGVVMYELLTGERPFRGQRRMVLLQVLEEDPRPPRRLNDRIPRDLETICLKSLAKAPGRRYASAQHLADDINRFLCGETIHARPVGAPQRLWRWSRRNPIATLLTIAVVVGLTAGLVHLSRLSGHLLEQTALESASMHAEMLERMNALYSDAVATPMRDLGIDVTHEFANKESAIPLPATFTIALGEDMQHSDYGMKLRLYSDYPFRSRADGGPKDEFEREALQALRANPDSPVYKFENYGGRYSLRYATARRMQSSCVSCHNSHPDSTRRDWKVGDVRGVVEIIHPLQHDVTRTSEGLRGTFILMLLISGGFLLLAVAIGVFGHVRRRRRFASTGEV